LLEYAKKIARKTNNVGFRTKAGAVCSRMDVAD
jgi:hypothetical protein